MDRRKIYNRMQLILLSMVVYFCCDFLIQITGFLQFESYVGLKSFLPVTLGLLFGIYGIIGELIACTITSLILGTYFVHTLVEYVLVIIPGIICWISWHIHSYTHKIHFRFYWNFIRYICLLLVSYILCAVLVGALVGVKSALDIIVWGVSMSIIIGIPIDIIYSGLMCLNPILPPIKVDGKLIAIEDDIREFLYNDPLTLSSFNEKLELLADKEMINMKRMFEIQSCIEEIYLRIIKKYPDAKIDVRASYDITFSIEFMYIGNKYNPFYIGKDEDESDVAGLGLIKHRALLVSFNYSFGENQIHVVI